MNLEKIYDDEGQCLMLAAQSVLMNYRHSLSLDASEILDLSNRIRQEARLFKEASDSIRMNSDRNGLKMNSILTLLQDEHLIESYAEAQSLNLDPNFLDMLRSEILRRGILNLVECDN
ncbi:hypothetical protein J19TS2_32390 [Cohnella xylanilytica]|uniref:sporulation histidine kinase inhibitor Sda n=1 Tax=Cohnella xylanilytica TaxID=557555 RepID=UPI001B226E0A|nr:sporulation histidine kinase inhibitor Sda [Cohnella xylanilytica]GIO13684.1 hypothetical protein J19TS2_32390 [Cohnella xylanilytica]